MRTRLFLSLTFLALLAAAPAARAAEPAAPTFVVRVAPLDDLLADARYLATWVDREELVKQLEGMLKAQGETKAGVFGLDPKKPIGLYGTVGPQGFDSSAVLLLPVADEETFLGMLRLVGLKPKKGNDGLYTAEVDLQGFNAPVYFRFANGYAYVTALTRAAVAAGALLKPTAVFPASADGALSGTFRVDQVSPDLKQLALGQIALRLAEVRDKQFASDSKARQAFWEQAFDDVVRNRLGVLFGQGKDVTLRLAVDRKAGEVVVEAAADGKPNSKLAASLTELGQASSLFGRLGGKDAGARVAANLTLPENVRKALAAVVEERLQKALDGASDATRKEQAQKFFDAVGPSLKTGELDAVIEVRPAGKLHTLVVGAKIKDGAAIEKAVRELLPELPAGDRARIKLDAATAGTVKVHQIDAKDEYQDAFKEVFGDGPICFALRSDALLVTAGEGALAAIQEAVAAKAGPSAVLAVDLSVRRLAGVLAAQRDAAAADIEKAATEAFKGADGDTVRFTVEGGKALTARFVMKAAVLKFLAVLGKTGKK